jgi:hypothetical protein
MANYAEYFAARDAEKPKPKFNYGDRVFGHWNRIPFIASVIREDDKVVLVQTDLPVKHEEQLHNILKLARMDVKLLKNYD